MELKELQKHWHTFGRQDPFYAILTDPSKAPGAWTKEEFFATGQAEVTRFLQYIEALNRPLRRTRALDFGCGVGRITQALCQHFEECSGVDIAPSMIALAKTYNQYGKKCQYYLNRSNHLKLFQDSTFDFIYSIIVLQHMKPEYSKHYIQEFLRVLAPGGIAIFQLPSEPTPVEKQPAGEPHQLGQALPPTAFRASIRVLNPPTVLKAGSRHTLQVAVKNDSPAAWPALANGSEHYQIRLGNHWLDEHDNTLINDDGRASLPQDLQPQETVTCPLVIRVPPTPGRYVLELDLVQEYVSWFKDQGSEPARIKIQVKRFSVWPMWRKPFTPVMEMYGLPQDLVVDLVEHSGGNVLDVQQDNRAGQSWLSLTYCITK